MFIQIARLVSLSAFGVSFAAGCAASPDEVATGSSESSISANGVGAGCEFPRDCAAGLVCTYDGLYQSTCKVPAPPPVPGVGAVCEFPRDCAAGLVCTYDGLYQSTCKQRHR